MSNKSTLSYEGMILSTIGLREAAQTMSIQMGTAINAMVNNIGHVGTAVLEQILPKISSFVSFSGIVYAQAGVLMKQMISTYNIICAVTEVEPRAFPVPDEMDSLPTANDYAVAEGGILLDFAQTIDALTSIAGQIDASCTSFNDAFSAYQARFSAYEDELEKSERQAIIDMNAYIAQIMKTGGDADAARQSIVADLRTRIDAMKRHQNPDPTPIAPTANH